MMIRPALILAALVVATPATPEADWASSPIAFLLSQQPASIQPVRLTRAAVRQQPAVAHALATAAAQRLGHRWVQPALRIAKIESGYRCEAQGPRLREGDRAQGLGQVRPGSARALGYTGTVAGMRDCATGIDLMLRHMARCIEVGATTDHDMARCHVAGWGSLGRRLRPRAERYAARYRVMVAQAAVPAWDGWLARGSVAAPWAGVNLSAGG